MVLLLTMDIYSQIYSHHSLYQMIVIFLLLFHIVSSNLQTMIISSLGIRSCSAAQSLTVSSDSDCEKLHQDRWTSITVNQGLCNSMTNNLTISDNACLESLVFKKNSLRNLNSLVISNNTHLSSIVTENGSWDKESQSYNAPFENVKSVEISSIF